MSQPVQLIPPRSHRRGRGPLAAPRLTALALLAAGLTGAQAQTWSGLGFTNAWSDFGNWTAFNPPVSSPATAVVFGASSRLSSVQNLGAPFVLNALTFNAQAGAYELTGGALRFDGANARLTQGSSSNIKIGNEVQLNANLAVNTSGALDLAGGLTRVAGTERSTLTLTKQGAGTLSLSAAGSYDAIVRIDAGQVRVRHALALQNAIVQLNLDSGLSFGALASATLGSLTGAGALNLGATALTLAGSDTVDPYSGAITGSAGSVTKAGSAAVRWTGVSQFDNLQVSGGRLQLEAGSVTLTNGNQGLMVGTANAPGSVASVLAVKGGALLSATGSTVQVDGAAGTLLSITNTGSTANTGFQTLVGNHASGDLTVDGGGTLNAATYLGIGYDNFGKGTLKIGSGGTVTSNIGMLGVLSGANGTADVTGTGAQWRTNSLTIGGFDASRRGGSGALTVGSGGLVQVANALSFWSANASVTVDGGTLRAGGLSSDGAFGSIVLKADPAGGSALWLEGSANTSFAGLLSGGGTLLKSGSGAQTLAGASIDFTGSTRISGGQIVIGHQSALAGSTVELDVNDGLNLNGLSNVTIGSLAGTGALNLGDTSLVLGAKDPGLLYSGAITGGKGNVVVAGGGLSRWAGASRFDNLQITSGRLQLEGGALTLTDTDQVLMVGGGENAAGGLTTLTLSKGAQLSATGRTVQVDGAAGTLLYVTGTGSTVATGIQALVGNHAIGKLQVDGGGTLNATTYLGMGFDLNGNGTLQVGAGGTVTSNIGMLGVKTGAVGTADVAGNKALWTTNAMTIGGFNADLNGGTGTLTVRDGGLVQVRDAVSFWSGASGITIDGGRLRVGTLASTLGHGNIMLQADPVGGVALELNGAADSSFAGVLTGGGTLLKTGTGAQALAGASPGFTGTTRIRGGQIVVGHQDALRGSLVSIELANGLNVNGLANVVVGSLAGTGALALGNTQFTLGEDNRSTTYGGVLTGAGGVLVKKGTGAFTMTGSGNSINRLVVEGGGTMVLDGGSLALSSNSDAAGALTLNAGGRVEVRGTAQLSANASGRASIYLAGDATTELLIDGPGARVNGGFQALAGVNGQGRITVRNGGSFVGANALGAGFYDGSNGTVSFESGAQGTAPLLLAGVLAGSTGNLLVSGNGTVVQATGAVGLGGVSNDQYGGTGTMEVSDRAIVTTPRLKFWTAGSSLRVDGATVFATTLESAAGAGSISLVSDPSDRAALILGGGPGSYSYGGNIDGDGSVTKTGVGTQALAGHNSFTGKVTVQGGTLTMASSAASEYEVNAFGTLRLGERNLGLAVVQANAGGQVVYTSTTLNGGQLIGPGGHDIGAVRRLVGTRVGGGTSLTPASGTTFVGVVNEGNVDNLIGRSLTWTGGSNPTGSVLVAGTTTVSNFSSGGQLQVGSTGTLVSTSGNLVLGGGSRTTVGEVNAVGGTIELRAGGRVQLNGGLLVNNGRILAPVEVNYGSLAKGAGEYGAVFVNDGGRFSPGNSPGTVTTADAIWGAGGGLVVELAQASGIAGLDWDLWVVHGSLSVQSGTTANSRFTVSLATLDGSNMAAPLAGFHPDRAWQWRIVDTDAGILGFDPARVALDTQGFLNPLAGGTLRLAVQGDDLYLQFNPLAVPEPQTWALLLGGLGVLGWAARRRTAG